MKVTIQPRNLVNVTYVHTCLYLLVTCFVAGIDRVIAPPVLIHEPDSVTVYEGSSASFTCTWNGNYHVGWRMSPKALNHSLSSNGTSTTLTVNSVSVHDNGTEIWCTASSGNGTVESNTAILLVLGTLVESLV